MFSDQALRHRFAFLRNYQAVAIAVSGGADSLALLHLIGQWYQVHNKQKSSGNQGGDLPIIHVLTVDHGLRIAAKTECAFVLNEAKTLGFKAEILKWEGDKPTTALQEKAREARYGLFKAYCAAQEIPVLLMAHQQDDQVETFLMRLARGGGVDSLSAILPSRYQEHLLIVRPLLDVSKKDLKRYLQERKIKWIEDPSNQNSAYERIQVRQNMACLETINLTPKAITESARRLARARQALAQIAQRLYDTEVRFVPFPVFVFRVDLLETEPEEIIIRLLFMIFKKMTFVSSPPELKQVERLVTGLKDRCFKKSCLSGCEVMLYQNHIFIYRETGRISEPQSSIELYQDQPLIWDQRFEIKLRKKFERPVYVRSLGQEAFASFRKNLDMTPKLLDFLKICPAAVGGALVSLWQEDTLIAVPTLDYYSKGIAKEDVWCRGLILKASI